MSSSAPILLLSLIFMQLITLMSWVEGPFWGFNSLKQLAVDLYFVSVFVYYNKIVNHGGRRWDTAQALARWWHPVASSVAPDVLHRAMCIVSYRCIAMAIKTASNPPVFLSSSISLSPTAVAKYHVMVQIIYNRVTLLFLCLINLIVLYGCPLSTMNAVSATIYNSR